MKNFLKKLTSFSIPVILLFVGLYLVPIKIFEPNFSKIIGDMGDARFNNYILEHGHKYLHDEVNIYWDAPMMFPYKNVIAFSDNLLGTMPIYSLFRSIGNDRETSFQFWIICIFALNFILGYWAFKKWCKNNILSATAAYIFAFGIYNIGHFEHVQVFPKFIVPFVLYWFWSFLSNKHLKYFLYASFGLVFQFYCGIYLGFFLIYGLLFLLIAYFIIYKDWEFFRRFKNNRTISIFCAITVISAILLSFLLIPYFEIIKVTGMHNFSEIISTIPRPVAYFFTHIASKNWFILTQHSQFAFPNWWSHFHFVGALPWIGIIISFFLIFSKKIYRDQKRFISFLLLTLTLNICFCLNIWGFSLYKIIYMLPGFSSMRSLDRILNIQILFFLFVFVFVFIELLKIQKNIKWLIFLFPLLVIIDNFINIGELKRFDKAIAQEKVKDIEDNISAQYNNKFKAIAYMPIISKPTNPDIHNKTIELQISTILAAQSLKINIVNAYTGHYPDNYMPFFDNMDNKTLSGWCDYNNCDINQIQQINDIGANIKSIKSFFLKASNGKFICNDIENNNMLIANRDSAKLWETFNLILFSSGKCGIFSFENKFISADIGSKNEITANRTKMKEWETFTLQKIDDNHVAFKAINDNYFSIETNTGRLFASAKTIAKNEIFELFYK